MSLPVNIYYICHPEPHSSAFWTVKLSCGHYTDVCVLDVEWRPEDGPTRVTKKRLAEIRRDFEEYWVVQGRTGWLVPRPKPAPPPLTERQMVEKKLAKAEAEVQRLRRKLERSGDA